MATDYQAVLLPSVLPGLREASLHCLRAEQPATPPAAGWHLRGRVPVHAAFLAPQQVGPVSLGLSGVREGLGETEEKRERVCLGEVLGSLAGLWFASLGGEGRGVPAGLSRSKGAICVPVSFQRKQPHSEQVA